MIAARERNYLLALAAVCVGAAALRLGGLGWLTDVVPHPGYSFHPDVMRFIEPLADFETIKGWRGYPLGFTTQLFVISESLAFAGLSIDPVTLLRCISLTYGLMMVYLAGWLARYLTGSTAIGLLTAVFLALSPLHLINSFFGTPDGAAAFFLYVTLIFGWRSLRYGRDIDFVLFVATIGLSLAIKFYFPLLVPLAIVVWRQPKRVERAVLAAFVLAGSFSLANFFNYTPWELKKLIRMLLNDNVDIAAGFGPIAQLGLYAWDTLRALGLGVWPFFVVGLASAIVGGWRRASRISFRAMMSSPYIVPGTAFLAFFGAVLVAEIHAPRHLLVFLPLMCFAAAQGFLVVSRMLRRAPFGVAVLLAALVFYQTYNALGFVDQYGNDIRGALAAKIEDLDVPPEQILTFSEYSLVHGVRLANAQEAATSKVASPYLVTCDLEYARYLVADDASEVFHPRGGQARLDLFRGLFGKRTEYELVYEVTKQPRTLEERLASQGVLSNIGEFTNDRCVIFARRAEVTSP